MDLVTIGFAAMVFCTVVWPLMTYAGDALRYLWYRLKGVGK